MGRYLSKGSPPSGGVSFSDGLDNFEDIIFLPLRLGLEQALSSPTYVSQQCRH